MPEKEMLAYEEGHDADLLSSESGIATTERHRANKAVGVAPEKSVSSNVSILPGDAEKVIGTTTVEELHDPNIVDWDGPDDPENPLNWSAGKKWANIAVLSALTLLTPLASSMFAPGVPEVLKTFDTKDENLATFVVSVYLLGFAL